MTVLHAFLPTIHHDTVLVTSVITAGSNGNSFLKGSSASIATSALSRYRTYPVYRTCRNPIRTSKSTKTFSNKRHCSHFLYFRKHWPMIGAISGVTYISFINLVPRVRVLRTVRRVPNKPLTGHRTPVQRRSAEPSWGCKVEAGERGEVPV